MHPFWGCRATDSDTLPILLLSWLVLELSHAICWFCIVSCSYVAIWLLPTGSWCADVLSSCVLIAWNLTWLWVAWVAVATQGYPDYHLTDQGYPHWSLWLVRTIGHWSRFFTRHYHFSLVPYFHVQPLSAKHDLTAGVTQSHDWQQRVIDARNDVCVPYSWRQSWYI